MATSKLIHGGLRYLKNMDFTLVRESLRERRCLSDMIPHQVRPLPFLLPIYKRNFLSRYYLAVGFALYDLLSFDKNRVKDDSKRLKNHKWLSAEEALKREPRLFKKGLLGAFHYYDLQNIHPERMNIDFLASAEAHGAIVANHLEVVELLYNKVQNKKRINGVRVKDKMDNGSPFTISSKMVVNCSGPWINQVLNKIKINVARKFVFSKGIHLLMPKRQGNQAIFMKTKNNQHLLILPWLGYTLLGITDTVYQGSPDALMVSKEDMEGLIKRVNEYYPANYKQEEVIHAYAGLRVLTNTSKHSTQKIYKASRKPKIIDHAPQGVSGLISVVGGKYTTSRSLAEKVVDYIQIRYKLGNMICKTKETPLKSANYGTSFQRYRSEIHKKWEEKYSSELLDHLLEYYGTYSQRVITYMEADRGLRRRIHPSNIRVHAEVHHAIHEESARTLSDFLYRRCGWGNEGLKEMSALKTVAESMGKVLHWSPEKMEEEISGYLEKQIL